MSKYDALGDFLRRQTANEVRITFEKIERITRTRLPISAKRHRAWWSNNPDNSVMTKVWLDAGFESEQVDMAGERLVFRRVRRVSPERSGGSGAAEHHAVYGWMKGTVRIAPGVDLTEPADPDWANRLDQ